MTTKNSLQSEVDKAYIIQVKQLINNEPDLIKLIPQIEEVHPSQPSVFAQCIQACLPDLEWDAEYTYDYLAGDELKTALENDAIHSLKNIERIIQDFENGLSYRIEYRLTPVYSRIEGNDYSYTLRHKAIAAEDLQDASKKMRIQEPEIPKTLSSDGKTWTLERVDHESRTASNDGTVIRDWFRIMPV